jgi:Predicted hydrolases or acyltransferases (alpha/beta hydrolase superfamily)
VQSLRPIYRLSPLVLIILFHAYGSAQSVSGVLSKRALSENPAIQDRFITVANLRVHYWEAGEGPTVVMIHGNAGSVEDFDFGALAFLSSTYRVVAIDRPGHGRSDRPKKATVEVQTELLHETLSSLRINQTVLVGHSWGGALALAYALKYPNEVAALVLLAPAAYPDEYEGGVLESIAQTPVIGDLSFGVGKTLFGHRMLRRALVKAFYPERVPERYLKLTNSSWLSRKHLKAYIEDELGLNDSLKVMKNRYAEISVPVVIVTGDRDQIVSPIKNAYELHANMPQSQLIEIKNTGHEIPLTHPESLATALTLISLTLHTSKSSIFTGNSRTRTPVAW